MEPDLKLIIGEALSCGFPSHFVVPDADRLPNYQHFTFSISSISEYLDVVKCLTSQKSDRLSSDTMVFRGMSDYRWDLIPSIARSDFRDDSTEHEMVNEFMTLRPESFQDLHSNFELLAKMQHYGLPTRLLDFTTNPLKICYYQKHYGLNEAMVGMEDTEENRQRILEVSTRESLDSVYPIYTPPDFYKPKHNDNVAMRNFTVTYQSMQRLFSSYEKPIAKRVDADGFAIYTEDSAVSFERRFSIVDEIQKIDPESLEHQFCSIIIESKHKSCILNELESIGIDKAFVYPELEYTAEKIKKKYLS